MVFGLDDDKATAVKDKKPTAKKADDNKSDSNANEAQELLKKMQEKEDNGDCAFC